MEKTAANKTTFTASKAFILLLLLSLTTLAPLAQNQFVTGPLVNAMLYITVVLLGIRSAVLLSFLPSLVALGVGILAPSLAPMVPFIMASNIVMVLLFNLLKTNFTFGVFISAAIKFVVLTSAAIILQNFIDNETLASKLLTLFTWPQLITALAGGLIAFVFLKMIKKV